jgi:peptide/nickel transport system substrate-binding protein
MARSSILCAVGALALVVGAMSSAADAQQPKRGGTLRFAVGAEPPNYDCHGATSFAFIHPVRPHYNTLLKFDEPNYPKLKGDLAQSWEVAKDGLTYTFKLKPNIKFHDGTALTSADVKATYERIANPPKGVVSIRKAAYDEIRAIETPDPQTVVFRLKARNASMLTNFASPWDCIYSAAKLKQDPNFPLKNILGTGPFKFVRHEAGSRWIGERFADYFEKGRPYLDGFEAIFITNTAARVNALQAGQVLSEFRGHSPADRDRMVKALGDKVAVHESPWVCSLVVSFNVERKPFDDARVRRALSLAIDRWRGAQALSKIALVRHVGGVLRPGFSLAASEKELVQYPGYGKDINKARAEARKLLAAAGVKNLSFRFLNRNVAMPYTHVGVFLIDQWRQIGVTAKHEQPETRAYIASLRGGNYDVGMDFNCDAVDDPNLQLAKYISFKRSPINYSRSNDEKLDKLYDAQQGELDEKKRYALLREFEKHALEQAYTFPTIWWHRIIVHWKQMKGWYMSPSHYINQDLQDVWLDQ